MTETTRPSNLWRALGLAVVAVFSLGQSASAIHYAVIAHELCAEHGELIHSDGAAHHSVSNPSSETALEAVEVEHQHDHCDCIKSNSHHSLLSAPSASAADTIFAGAPPGHQKSARLSAQSTYSFAPKTSPPLS